MPNHKRDLLKAAFLVFAAFVQLLGVLDCVGLYDIGFGPH